MRRFIIFNNPRSGSALASADIAKIRIVLESSGGDVTIVEGADKESSIDILRSELSTATHVVAVGGDGTISLVSQEIIQSGIDVVLLPIPAGTGNDLANYFGIDRDPVTAIRQLLTGDEKRLDYGRVTWTESGDSGICGVTIFVNSFGIGFDAAAADRVDKFKRFGGLSYTMAGVDALRGWQDVDGTIEYDNGNRMEAPLMFAAVCNSSTSGGGFRLAPNAMMNDGLLDVFVAHSLAKIHALILLPLIRLFGRGGENKITRFASSKVKINVSRGVPVHCDGEVISKRCSSVEVTCMHEGLRVMVPRTAH